MGSNNPEQNKIVGALTFPTRSEDNAQTEPVQPRQPRNLQGLLRFAMEATKAEDAPGNSEFGPMDEEVSEKSFCKCLGVLPSEERKAQARRKFLEEALKSLTVNVAEVLQKSITTLTNTEKIHSIQLGQPLPDDVDTAFNNLLEFIDQIDTANDFYKMGGFAVFPIAYGSENDDIRARASSVLAELCQNNPFCQARAHECGLLNVLLNLVQSERGNALTKCLYALSCATREYEPACRELVAQGGCEALAQLLRTPEISARTKVAFFIRYLCHNYPEAKEQFINLNIVAIIAEQIKAGRDASTEHLLSTLVSLTEGMPPEVVRQCRDPSIGLQKIIDDHLKFLELEGDRYREEKEYCQLLKQMFENCPAVENVCEEVADR